MKIFIVCTRLCYGGAEHVGVMLANGFARRGHDVTVVANLFDPITYKLDEAVCVRNLVATNNHKMRKWGSSIFLMYRYMKEQQPDVVIGILNTASLVAKIAALLVRLNGLFTFHFSQFRRKIPVVMTEHDAFERPTSAPFSFENRFGKFWLNKIYNHITVLTDVDKSVIGNRLNGIKVMPNPLSIEPVESVPDNKEKIILAAGRVDDWHVKGFDVLIKAWAKIYPSHKDWRLCIAGKDENGSLPMLQKWCKDYGVDDSISFLGFRDDMVDLYRRASIFVLSSRYEGFGLVLIEAMSQGCACVAADYNGRQSEIITNEEEGMTCPPDDADALAEGMRRMMDDDTYRKKVQYNAIKRSEYYHIENIIRMWEYYLKDEVLKNE